MQADIQNLLTPNSFECPCDVSASRAAWRSTSCLQFRNLQSKPLDLHFLCGRTSTWTDEGAISPRIAQGDRSLPGPNRCRRLSRCVDSPQFTRTTRTSRSEHSKFCGSIGGQPNADQPCLPRTCSSGRSRAWERLSNTTTWCDFDILDSCATTEKGGRSGSETGINIC